MRARAEQIIDRLPFSYSKVSWPRLNYFPSIAIVPLFKTALDTFSFTHFCSKQPGRSVFPLNFSCAVLSSWYWHCYRSCPCYFHNYCTPPPPLDPSPCSSMAFFAFRFIYTPDGWSWKRSITLHSSFEPLTPPRVCKYPWTWYPWHSCWRRVSPVSFDRPIKILSFLPS